MSLALHWHKMELSLLLTFCILNQWEPRQAFIDRYRGCLRRKEGKIKAIVGFQLFYKNTAKHQPTKRFIQRQYDQFGWPFHKYLATSILLCIRFRQNIFAFTHYSIWFCHGGEICLGFYYVNFLSSSSYLQNCSSPKFLCSLPQYFNISANAPSIFFMRDHLQCYTSQNYSC